MASTATTTKIVTNKKGKKFKVTCNGDTCTRVEIKDEAPAPPKTNRVQYKQVVRNGYGVLMKDDVPAKSKGGAKTTPPTTAKTRDAVEEKSDPAPKGAAPGEKFIAMLGDTLMDQGGKTIKTSELVKNDIVGLYFSAHWCPPCRNFTPMFAKVYNDLRKKGKKLDVVFISSDQDEPSMLSYFKESHPWKAIPFKDRERKAMLSQKYKVKGIPKLVFVDPKTGKHTEKDGTSRIRSDPTGAKFPWPKIQLRDVIGEKGAKILTKKKKDFTSSGKDTTFEKLLKDNNYLMLYFSASWCGPCRMITPIFAQWYTKNYKEKQGTGQSFEAVFLSADEDKAAFKEYYKKMPWGALDFAKREMFSDLSRALQVNGYPTIVILDKQLNVITDDAVKNLFMELQGRPAGSFPWKKEVYTNFNEDPQSITQEPSLVFFTDNMAASNVSSRNLNAQQDSEQGQAIALLKKLAETRQAELAKEDEEMDMGFYYVPSSDGGQPGGQLRKLFGITGNTKVKAAFVNFRFGAFKLLEELDEKTLAPMVAKHAARDLKLDMQIQVPEEKPNSLKRAQTAPSRK